MLEFLKRIGAKILKFFVDLVCKVTLLATLISVAVCLVLFFLSFFAGEPIYAVLSLVGMLCFLYTNKQF